MTAGRSAVACGLLARLLPGFQVVEEFGDLDILGTTDLETCLHTMEAAVVAGAADSRKREFAAARGCVHKALSRLGRTLEQEDRHRDLRDSRALRRPEGQGVHRGVPGRL